MDLSKENKAIIDGKTYYELLEGWRFSAVGDAWFTGDTGQYWKERMAIMRDKDPAGAVADSKAMDWQQNE